MTRYWDCDVKVLKAILGMVMLTIGVAVIGMLMRNEHVERIDAAINDIESVETQNAFMHYVKNDLDLKCSDKIKYIEVSIETWRNENDWVIKAFDGDGKLLVTIDTPHDRMINEMWNYF